MKITPLGLGDILVVDEKVELFIEFDESYEFLEDFPNYDDMEIFEVSNSNFTLLTIPAGTKLETIRAYGHEDKRCDWHYSFKVLTWPDPNLDVIVTGKVLCIPVDELVKIEFSEINWMLEEIPYEKAKTEESKDIPIIDDFSGIE